MKILESCEPGSLEWSKVITATKAVNIVSDRMGFTSFGSPLSEWHRITSALRGEVLPDKDNAFMRYGRVTEPLHREILEQEFGLRIDLSPGLVQDSEFPWLGVTPDGGLSKWTSAMGTEKCPGPFEGPGLLELKSKGLWTARSWDGPLPVPVIIQVQMQLRVTKLTWGIASGFLPPTSADSPLLIFEGIPRSEGVIENAIDVLQDFWENNILKDIPPPATGSDTDGKILKKMYASFNKEKTAEFSEEIIEGIPRYEEAKAELRVLDKEVKTYKNRMVQEIGKNQYGEGGGFRYSLNETNKEGGYVQPCKFRVLRKMKVKA